MLSLQTVNPDTLELLKFENVGWEYVKKLICQEVESYNQRKG